MAEKKNCKSKLSYFGQTKPKEAKTNSQPKPSGQTETPRCDTSSNQTDPSTRHNSADSVLTSNIRWHPSPDVCQDQF